MSSEISFVMVKPDGVQRGLIAEIFSRLEKKGFKLVGAHFMQASEELAKKHYAEHEGKKFFPGLISFLTSGPVFAMVWEGKGVVASVRQTLGVTNPLNAAPGTIRGDYGIDMGRNLCHASDSAESGIRETELWFGKDIVQWKQTNEQWLKE
jgi:nucleoside-diphosphate kinase